LETIVIYKIFILELPTYEADSNILLRFKIMKTIFKQQLCVVTVANIHKKKKNNSITYLKKACASILRFMLLEQTTAIEKSLIAIVSTINEHKNCNNNFLFHI